MDVASLLRELRKPQFSQKRRLSKRKKQRRMNPYSQQPSRQTPPGYPLTSTVSLTLIQENGRWKINSIPSLAT